MTHYPLLLHGDALDILPTLLAGTVDVVVTDPPVTAKVPVEFRGVSLDRVSILNVNGPELKQALDLVKLKPNLPRRDFDPLAYGVNVLVAGLVLIIGACGPQIDDDAGSSFGDSSDSESGDGDGLDEVTSPCEPDPVPEPIVCGAGVCPVGHGCTIADTCVDCDFVVGVYGCDCNISGECESTSSCVDGTCSAY